jgi:hypothetical protein
MANRVLANENQLGFFQVSKFSAVHQPYPLAHLKPRFGLTRGVTDTITYYYHVNGSFSDTVDRTLSKNIYILKVE